MTKREIFNIERTNYDKVICYKEGHFWVAYEHSAFLFCKYVRPFKPSRKFIQAVGEDVIAIGFPDQGWNQIAPMVTFLEKTDKRIVLNIDRTEASLDEFMHNFETWKDGVQGFASLSQRVAAPHENLPVYKAVYDLTVKIFRQSQHVKKELRYTLGEKLKNEAMELLINIYAANSSEEEKESYISDARRRIELIRVMLRIMRDLRQFSIKDMASINLDIDEITKQLVAWHKATLKKLSDREKNNGKSSVG